MLGFESSKEAISTHPEKGFQSSKAMQLKGGCEVSNMLRQ